ncbi:MAG TPA: glycosyltransferase family 4 protein [Terriglobales bacterium]|nr:glycosyltransferase family 4 protein [Terriglobales bacterium]
MKVWVVSHAYVTPVNHDKLRALAALGDVALTVMIPDGWRTPTGMVRLPRVDAPYPIVTSRISQNGRIGAYRYRDLAPLRRARPDIVHGEVEPWSLAALQLVRAAAGAPVVLFTWENLAGPRRLLSRAVERYVLARAAHVIAGNEGARTRMRRLGVGDDRLTVLPQLGIDPPRFAHGDGARAAGVPPADGAPMIGFIGRVVPEKGIDVLLDAAAGLDVRVLIVGDGAARAALEARTAGWPAGKATFAGAVADADVPHYLARLDALVLPSRTTASWAEQFGHVLIEAMAAGVPVVGSSSGAIPEVIGDAGLVFTEGDASALAAQLDGLVRDAALRKRLAERGRARVERLYTNDRVARTQRDLYLRLLRRHKGEDAT